MSPGASESRNILKGLQIGTAERQLRLGDFGWEGRWGGFAVGLANREKASSRRALVVHPRQYGVSGVQLVVSDDRQARRQAITALPSVSARQRCVVDLRHGGADLVSELVVPGMQNLDETGDG